MKLSYDKNMAVKGTRMNTNQNKARFEVGIAVKKRNELLQKLKTNKRVE